MKTCQNKIYHIYNRGNRKDLICLEGEDFDFLVKVINESFNRIFFDVISICVMPNHFHLLVSQTQKSEIWRGMHRIGTLYPKYFNKKYGLTGHLFEDSYKCKQVGDFIYFRKIVDYIRENPRDLIFFSRENFRLYENLFLQDYYNILLTYPDE